MERLDVRDVRDKTKEDVYMCDTLLKMFRRGEFRKNHPQQRNADKWGREARDGLIVTVIRHEDVDSIKICEQIVGKTVVLWLIDGLQRLTNIQAYKAGMFKLGKNIEMPLYYYQKAMKDSDGNVIRNDQGDIMQEVIEYDLRNKSYDDLPEEIKDKFNNYQIKVTKHLNCTDEEVGYHIRRYNRQVSMNQNEVSITYMDHIAQKVKSISRNNTFFKNCGKYTSKDQTGGNCDRIICESLMLMFYEDDWKKSSKDTGAFLNTRVTSEQFETLDSELKRLETIVGDGGFKTIFTTKNSFVFFALFHEFTKMGLDDGRFRDFLNVFESGLQEKKLAEFDDVSFDDINKGRATKDKKVVKAKFGILKALLGEYLKEDLAKEDVDIVNFIADCIDVESNVIEEDLDFYEETLNKLLDDHVLVGSSHLEEKNRPSLLAVVAYSCKEDVDLDEWITRYTFQNTYLKDQRKNFEKMKHDLENFIASENLQSA